MLHEANPWDAHLVLGEGQRLDVNDILSLRLKGVVVVLNGCETGPDAILARDDALGLPEAFLAAGAHAVVATNKVVPDAAARRFTELFYAHGGVERPAHALQKTRAAMKAEGNPSWDVYRLIGRR